MHGNCRPMADFDRSVGNRSASNTLDPILYVILIASRSLHGFAIWTIHFLGPVSDCLIKVIFQRAIAPPGCGLPVRNVYC